MHYPTQLHDRLLAIEKTHVADPDLRKPAPFIRLHSQHDRVPSLKTIRDAAKRLGIQFEEAVDGDGLPIPELASMFRPRLTPVQMLTECALDGAAVDMPN